ARGVPAGRLAAVARLGAAVLGAAVSGRRRDGGRVAGVRRAAPEPGRAGLPAVRVSAMSGAQAVTVDSARGVPSPSGVSSASALPAMSGVAAVSQGTASAPDVPEVLLAERVVLAAGAWSGELAEVPVRPVKGQIMRLRSPQPLLGRCVRGTVHGHPVYLVPRGRSEEHTSE